jgi:hypothetical protein
VSARNPSSERQVQRLKALPPDVDLRGGWNELKRWGDVMALVSADGFDPDTLSRKYVVWLSDVPAEERLQRQPTRFQYPNQPMVGQPFTFYDTRRVDRRGSGNLVDPVTYLVTVDKFSDLSVSEDAEVQKILRDKGYREAWKYQLSAPKWRKILAMGYEEARDHADYEIANAVDSLGSGWDFPGVYALTKKGAIKWVVSRNQKGTGL